MSDILIIEPFYGGSHKQLLDIIIEKIPVLKEATLITMTPKKWHWRARVSALQLYDKIPHAKFKVVFCSSVLNLTELCGLRPDIGLCKKIVYFHENQLIYPVQCQKDRDVQYGYNQITSCISADLVLFNSEFNMMSFLNSISSFLNIFPDYKIRNLNDKIRGKCEVLYYPIEVNYPINNEIAKTDVCHILWPHRWEHDKGPELFFKTLYELSKENIPFLVSVLGGGFSSNPTIFEEAKSILADHIVNFGYLDNKKEYEKVLFSCDVVVSTALHEFYGVAMLEAASCGCIVLCPDKLSYPEIFNELSKVDKAIFYKTDNQFKKILRNLCLRKCKGYTLNTDRESNRNYLKRFFWNDEVYARLHKIFQIELI